MKRLLAALCALLIASPAFASVTLTGAGKAPAGGGGGGYTGPGDVVTGAKAWYGLRAYNATYAASQGPAIRLSRASNADKCDVNVTTAGDLATVTANCSTGAQNGTVLSNGSTGWCDGTTCSIDTIYDQSGSGFNAVASATAPTFVFSCLGGKPCMQFGGAGGLLASTATSTAQILTISAVAIRTGGTGQQDILSDANGVFFSGAFGSGQASGWFGNSPTATAADSAWHALQFMVNSTTSAINVDGTDTTGLNFGTSAMSAGYYIGHQNTGSYLTGKIMEVGLWGPALGFTLTQRGNMCHNQFTYWGTATSC